MAQTRLIDRQYALNALVAVLPKHQGAGNGHLIGLPVNALVTSITVFTSTLFDGTTPTVTVTDGTTVFANAVDVTTAGAETVANTPKFYPTGGAITVSLAGTDSTVGQTLVNVEYLVPGRGGERAE